MDPSTAFFTTISHLLSFFTFSALSSFSSAEQSLLVMMFSKGMVTTIPKTSPAPSRSDQVGITPNRMIWENEEMMMMMMMMMILTCTAYARTICICLTTATLAADSN